MSFISKINYLVCTNQSVWIALVGMKTRPYLKHFSKTGISSQFDSEILSYKSTIYLLEQCLRENIVCSRLLPLLWSTDCDPKQKTFMNTMLAGREKYPYRVPIPDCPHNIKSVHSAEFLDWIVIDGYLVNVKLLLLLHREDEGIKKCVSLKALRILDRRDVDTALEIHRKEAQDSIPDEKVGTILVPALD